MNDFRCPKNCPERLVTADYNCHSNCIRHKLFQAQNEQIRRNRAKYNEDAAALWEATEAMRKKAKSKERINKTRRDYKD